MKRIKEFFKKLLLAIMAWLNPVIIHPCRLSHEWGEVIAYRGRFAPNEVGYLAAIVSENYVRIDHFRVREAERRKGIGKGLMKELITRLKMDGYKEIIVYPNSEPYVGDTPVEPEKLYRIYESLGFVFEDINADKTKPNNKMVLKIDSENKMRPISDNERKSFEEIIKDLEDFLGITCPPIYVSEEEKYSFFDEEKNIILIVKRDPDIMLIDLIHELRHIWQHEHGKGVFFENYHEEWEFSNKEDYMKQIEELDAIGFSHLISNALTSKDYLCDAGLSDELYDTIMSYMNEMGNDAKVYNFYINHLKED